MLTLSLLSQRQSLNSEIVAFSATTGEYYFFRISPDKLSHLGLSNLYCLPGSVAPVMKRGGIAKNLIQEWYYCLPDLRAKRSSGGII